MRATLFPLFLASIALPAVPALASDEAALTIPLPQQTATPTVARSDGTIAAAIAYIRTGRWDAAREEIAAMRDPALAAFARAELYLASNSPRVEGPALRELISAAPQLPQAARLTNLAQRRGVTDLPSLPDTQSLRWAGESPRRANPRNVNEDGINLVRNAIHARIVVDDPAGAESALTGASGLGSDAMTELQTRVAWAYYTENNDADARRVATLAQGGSGAWQAQADWTQGLAAWRQADYAAARTAFAAVVAHTQDSELGAAGNFWFARAAVAGGQPREAQAALRRAAAQPETFYGQLAAEALGLATRMERTADDAAADRRVAAIPNVHVAMALASAGETDLADTALRYQARIGPVSDHQALIRLAGQLSLANTQFYLAHNAPRGVRPDMASRFPAPNWTPSDGWRVDPALIFAHTLQESQFRTRVVSPAGAVGLMQVRPATGGDMGLHQMGGDLTNPAVNLAMGQSYIEWLRDNAVTGGQLPKVIAAYNAGPTPVARWNSEIRDGGDPLLYIESIPWRETRGYVGAVLRNLWIYEGEMGTRSNVRRDLVQHRWPRVPTASPAARMTAQAATGARTGGR